jgi:hypothetical protein
LAWQRFIVASDLHGDMQDSAAVNALSRFTREWKPKHRICLGDVWDFRALRTKASEEERRESLKADFDAGLAWLEDFAPTHDLLLGNHDIRLWDRAKFGNGPLADYCGELVARVDASLARCRVGTRPYHKRLGVLRLGHLKLLHGFYAGVTAARQHALAYGSCLFGHIHSIDEASVPGMDRRTARAVGCLCRLDMDYNRASVNTLRYASGFAYGVVDDKSGDYCVWQAEGVSGKYIVASETSVI